MKTDKALDSAPEDRKNFVYAVFYWLGIGTLLPWNFFISVPAYWDHKWRSVNETFDASVSNFTIPKNEMQTNWNSHLAVASMVPNVTMLLLNAVFGHKFRTQPRLFISLILVIVLFTFTDVMTILDTDTWQGAFYIVTLVSVVCININAAIFQGGLLGVAGKFPPRYIGGVFSGQALGGIFASATNIVFLLMGASVVAAAGFSFLIAVLFLFSALVCYYTVTRSEFFQHYVDEDGKKSAIEIPEDKKLMDNGAKVEDVKVVIPTKVNPLSALVRISFYAVSVFLIFAVTLGCFPAITVLVQSTHKGTSWGDVYFIPVCCFLLFNVGDFLGRTIAELLKWPRPGRVGMVITLLLSFSRVAFIPLFIVCNALPTARSVTPVVFESDWIYILLMTLFSLSNGYLGSICMMSAPQLCINPDEQQTAASLMVAILGLGLGSGAALSNVFVKLL